MKSLQLIVLFISAVNFTFPQDYFDHSNETADRISKLGVGNTKHETSTIKNEDFLTQNIILENSVMNKSEKFEVMTVKWNEPEDRVLAALVTFMGTQGIIYTIYAAVDPVNLNQPFVDYIESLAQGFVSGVIVGAVEFAAVMLNPVAGTALISLVNTPEFISVIQLAMAPLIEPLFDGTPIITLLTDLPDIFNGIRDEIDNLLSEELDPFIEEFGENQEIENNIFLSNTITSKLVENDSGELDRLYTNEFSTYDFIEFWITFTLTEDSTIDQSLGFIEDSNQYHELLAFNGIPFEAGTYTSVILTPIIDILNIVDQDEGSFAVGATVGNDQISDSINTFNHELAYQFQISQIEITYGCTDPDALNFNPDATEDDDSCIYESDGITISFEHIPFHVGEITEVTASLSPTLSDYPINFHQYPIMGEWSESNPVYSDENGIVTNYYLPFSQGEVIIRVSDGNNPQVNDEQLINILPGELEEYFITMISSYYSGNENTSTYTVYTRVYDQDGNEASYVSISLTTNFGIFQDSQSSSITFDTDGHGDFLTYLEFESAGECTITAEVENSSNSHTFEVLMQPQSIPLEPFKIINVDHVTSADWSNSDPYKFYYNSSRFSVNSYTIINDLDNILLTNGDGEIKLVRINPNEEKIVISVDDEDMLKLYNVSTGSLIATKLQTNPELYVNWGNIRWLSNDRMIVGDGSTSTGYSTRILEYDGSSTLATISDLRNTTWRPKDVSIGSDIFAIGFGDDNGHDGDVSIWDTNGNHLFNIDPHPGITEYTQSISVSPDDQKIAINDPHNQTIKIFDDSGNLISTLGSLVHIYDMAWHPINSDILATIANGGDDGVTIWNTETGVPLYYYPESEDSPDLGWSQNGEILSVVYADNNIKFFAPWDHLGPDIIFNEQYNEGYTYESQISIGGTIIDTNPIKSLSVNINNQPSFEIDVTNNSFQIEVELIIGENTIEFEGIDLFNNVSNYSIGINRNEIIFGCMDSDASNYNPDSTHPCNNDNSCCEYEGCTDPLAFNYYSLANIDDESCIRIDSVMPANEEVIVFNDANLQSGEIIFSWNMTNGSNSGGINYILSYSLYGSELITEIDLNESESYSIIYIDIAEDLHLYQESIYTIEWHIHLNTIYGDFDSDVYNFQIDGTSLDVGDLSIPTEFSISSYPNPFNPMVTLSYEVPYQSDIQLALYDITGKEIALLYSGFQFLGTHSIQWNGSNFPSGYYFVKLSTNKINITHKLMMIK